MAEPVEITVYSRENCHLCGVALQRIETVSEETGISVDVTEVDVDADDDLQEAYGERVPVVYVDGEERFSFTVDTDELATVLDAAR